MSFFTVLLIAFALALDAFSVAVATGSYFGKTSGRQKFRLSFHFGLFQFLMPITGWFAGSGIVNLIADYDHWIACALLCIIGIKLIWDSFSEAGNITKDITKGLNLVSLSVATSIDALAVGFSLGIIGGDILYPSVIIGFVAAGMTLVGIQSGEKLSVWFGKKAAFAGGIILILIGAHIVMNHLGVI